MRLSCTSLLNKMTVSLQFHEKYNRIMDEAIMKQNHISELIKRYVWLLFITAKKKMLQNCREDIAEVAYILYVVIRKALLNLPLECPFVLPCKVDDYLQNKMNAPKQSQEVKISSDLFEEHCKKVSGLGRFHICSSKLRAECCVRRERMAS